MKEFLAWLFLVAALLALLFALHGCGGAGAPPSAPPADAGYEGPALPPGAYVPAYEDAEDEVITSAPPPWNGYGLGSATSGLPEGCVTPPCPGPSLR